MAGRNRSERSRKSQQTHCVKGTLRSSATLFAGKPLVGWSSRNTLPLRRNKLAQNGAQSARREKAPPSQKELGADTGSRVPRGESNLNPRAFCQRSKTPTNVENRGLRELQREAVPLACLAVLLENQRQECRKADVLNRTGRLLAGKEKAVKPR